LIDLLAEQIIAPALNTLIGGPSKLFETSGDFIQRAIQRLMDRAIESGIVRPDLDPFRSAAGSRRRSRRRIRTGLAAERKRNGRYPSPGFLPDYGEPLFSPRTQRQARESATASGDSHLT
jgi:hypothetical protein